MADSVSLDWVSFTIIGFKDYGEVMAALGVLEKCLGRFTPESKGFQGYEMSGRFYGSGRVGWSRNLDMGIHCSFPSAALASFAVEHYIDGELVAFDFLSRILSMVQAPYRIQFTRLDIAFDDKESQLLDFQTIRRLCSGKSGVVSVFRKIWIPGLDLITGEEMSTIYFGSRESDTFLRIYDKAKERGLDEHWLRVELELKHKRADIMARLLAVDEGLQSAADYLYRYVDFKEQAEDSNKSRWPTASWWLEFIRAASKRFLNLPKSIVSIERSCNWMVSQVASTCALLHKALSPLQLDIFDLLINYGRSKLTAEHEGAIDTFQNFCSDISIDYDSLAEVLAWLLPDVPEQLRAEYLDHALRSP